MSYTEPSDRRIEWTQEGNQRQPHSHSCLAYELDFDDEPEPLSYVLMELLTERGADDPNVPTTRPTREHFQMGWEKISRIRR